MPVRDLMQKILGSLLAFGLPLASLVLGALAISSVALNREDTSLLEPPAPPPRSPFEATVACLGIVEPRGEAIEVGSALPGVVAEVFVMAGQPVSAGAPLFRLDDRALRAELRVRRGEVELARAQRQRLQNLPRPEEVPIARAKVDDARSAVGAADDEYQRALQAGMGVSEEARSKASHALKRSQAQLQQAQAELDLLRAGAWREDLLIAQQTIAKAEAVVQQIEVELERLIVRAPVEGHVLQVHVHPGESVGTAPGRALVLMGDLARLHVRASIDEHEIPRFRPGAPAQAFVVGQPGRALPLTFVRVEPQVLPKRTLSGDNRERVDTRVLEVIYELSAPADVYVGQQLNVYVQSPL